MGDTSIRLERVYVSSLAQFKCVTTTTTTTTTTYYVLHDATPLDNCFPTFRRHNVYYLLRFIPLESLDP